MGEKERAMGDDEEEERVLCVGIDGGGTKTKCVVSSHPSFRLTFPLDPVGGIDIEEDRSPDGHHWPLVSESVAGSANSNSVGVEVAVKNVVDACCSALKKIFPDLETRTKVKASHLFICVSTSGVDRPGDEKPFVEGLQKACARLLKRLVNQVHIKVVNDAFAALSAGVYGSQPKTLDWKLDALAGIVCIVGTGTIAFGVKESGGKLETARVSGWGPAFGDTGSGYDLGYKLLCAVARCHDGRDERKTVLTEKVLTHLQLDDPTQLITWAYSSKDWAHIAALAPFCLQAASEGDEVAMDIVATAAHQLAHSISVLKRKLFEDIGAFVLPIVLVGGLMESENILVDLLEDKLRRDEPGCAIIHPTCDAAQGAAIMAQKCFIEEKKEGAI